MSGFEREHIEKSDGTKGEYLISYMGEVSEHLRHCFTSFQRNLIRNNFEFKEEWLELLKECNNLKKCLEDDLSKELNANIKVDRIHSNAIFLEVSIEENKIGYVNNKLKEVGLSIIQPPCYYNFYYENEGVYRVAVQ